MLTVLASAIGPNLLAECLAATGSYATILYVLSGAALLLGAFAWFVSIPSAAAIPETQPPPVLQPAMVQES